MRHLEIINEEFNVASSWQQEENILTEYEQILKEYMKGPGIYRGMKKTGNIIVADGSKMNRKSANTTNYFTSLTEILPSWKGWPPRSKSFICAPQPNRARGYSSAYAHKGGGAIYLVIPIDGQPIAQGSTVDIWDSFKKGGHSVFGLKNYDNEIPGFNRIMENLFGDFSITLSDNFTPQQLYNGIKELDSKIENKYNGNDKDSSLGFLVTSAKIFIDNYMNKNAGYSSLFEYIDSAFDPVTNGCSLHETNKTLHYENEIWIGGKVLMIEDEYLNGMQEFFK